MKITKQQLIKIIKEELNEYGDYDYDGGEEGKTPQDKIDAAKIAAQEILEMAKRGVDDPYGAPLDAGDVKDFAETIINMLADVEV